VIPEGKLKTPLEMAYERKERAKAELDEALSANLYSSQRVLNCLVQAMQWQESFDSMKALAEGKHSDQLEMSRLAGKREAIQDLIALRDSIIQEESKNARPSTSN
jgi:hypothetical protein